MSTRLVLLLVGTALLFTLAGCGGGGGGGGGDGGGGVGADEPLLYATGPLRAQIQFPPDGSLGMCGQITVRGTAGGAGISAVRVNGVAATGFGEFGEWVARIPLVCGSNVIRVAVEAADGRTLSSADSVRLDVRETFLYAPRAVSVTSEPVAVYAVDLAGF